MNNCDDIITRLRAKITDDVSVTWTDEALERILAANSRNIYLATAECFEQLAADRDRAARWMCGKVYYTHDDLIAIAKYQRSLVKEVI